MFRMRCTGLESVHLGQLLAGWGETAAGDAPLAMLSGMEGLSWTTKLPMISVIDVSIPRCAATNELTPERQNKLGALVRRGGAPVGRDVGSVNGEGDRVLICPRGEPCSGERSVEPILLTAPSAFRVQILCWV